MSQEEFPYVNLSDWRQDVHKVRENKPNLYRYKVAETLLPLQANGLSVLELGGGTGEFTRRIIERGIGVTFVDLNENNLKRVEKLYGIKTCKVDLNLGLKEFHDSSFDGIVILEVIEHIVATEYLLKEMNRVLKPGGFLILTTPNYAYFLNRLRVLRGKLSLDEGYHYRFFTVKVLTKRLLDAGFKIEKSYHSAPAVGLNFFWNTLFKKGRIHIKIPRIFAPLLAQTLGVMAKKSKVVAQYLDDNET
jgi:2-polyprenyl-3-methyl-5-hydroxy-6-metoxy-1,4-benzoquinol methylase